MSLEHLKKQRNGWMKELSEPRSAEFLLHSLHNDEVITVNREERSALYELMEDKGIDPDDYRQDGNDVWLA